MSEQSSPFDGTQIEAGVEMKRIRNAAGLSIRELADLLYYNNEEDLRQMERGKRAISGPIRYALEKIADGTLRPEEDLTEQVDGAG